MLETCLENKIIYEFLTYYDQSCWHKLIPSLLEIAILNLKSSFNTFLFSEEDINNIIKDLIICNKKNLYYSEKPKQKKDNNLHIIFSKPQTVWRTSDGWDFESDPIKDRYSLSWKKNEEKIMNKRLLQSVRSKIKDQVDIDKKKYYNNLNFINNKMSQSYNQKEKINYAISYDKDLNPEIIERTTVKKNKNKKGGKKIIQKMTQEEYEQKYTEENQDNDNGDNNEIYYENNENGDSYDKQKLNKKQIYYKDLNNNQNNIFKISKNSKNKKKNQKQNINNRNQKKKNLYHYNVNYNIQNNKINNINNNIKTKPKNNFDYKEVQKKNIDINTDSQKGFVNQAFNNQIKKNNIKNNNINNINNINKGKNNYINIENNFKEENNNNNKFYFYRNINKKNNKIDPSINDSSGQNDELIGIEKKYKNKIDELEKNILKNEIEKKTNNNIHIDNNYNYDINKNNIDNYADKLKVNITNMEDYKMKKQLNNNINNNIEENIGNNNNLEINIINNDDEAEGEEIEEEEENNDNENNINDNNEMEEGDVLSQMSNMTEKGKMLFKKAMDEYPPLEEDNF